MGNAPEGDSWLHEIKLDGYRTAPRIEGGKVRLLTCTGLDWTAWFRPFATARSSGCGRSRGPARRSPRSSGKAPRLQFGEKGIDAILGLLDQRLKTLIDQLPTPVIIGLRAICESVGFSILDPPVQDGDR